MFCLAAEDLFSKAILSVKDHNYVPPSEFTMESCKFIIFVGCVEGKLFSLCICELNLSEPKYEEVCVWGIMILTVCFSIMHLYLISFDIIKLMKPLSLKDRRTIVKHRKNENVINV